MIEKCIFVTLNESGNSANHSIMGLYHFKRTSNAFLMYEITLRLKIETQWLGYISRLLHLFSNVNVLIFGTNLHSEIESLSQEGKKTRKDAWRISNQASYSERSVYLTLKTNGNLILKASLCQP